MVRQAWRRLGVGLGALLLLAGTAQAAEEAGGQWAGQVVDIRTNKPLAGVELDSARPGAFHNNNPGPVPTVKSGADGRFQLPLPKSVMKGMADGRVPYVLVANYSGKLRAVRMEFIRPMPGEVLLKLIPLDVYIKGRAVSAETGAPLPNIGVTLLRPGAVAGSATTDANGDFSFRPVPAFEATGGAVYDIRPPDLYKLEPHTVFHEKYASYAVSTIYGKGSEQFVDVSPPRGKDGRYEPSLPLVSSFDDSIHTYVLLRLPRKGTVVAEPGKHIAAEFRGLPAAPDTATAPGPAADIAGTWQHKATGESWTFTPLGGGRYTAVEKRGIARGTATVTGNKMTMEIASQDGKITVKYEATIAADGRSANVTLRYSTGQSGTYTWVRAGD